MHIKNGKFAISRNLSIWNKHQLKNISNQEEIRYSDKNLIIYFYLIYLEQLVVESLELSS